MSIDPNRVIAFHGIAGYDDWRKQPGRLGWGVGTKGYGPMVDTYLVPLVKQTNCRRFFLHNPFANAGEKEIPLDAPIRMFTTMPDVYASFSPAFERLATSTRGPHDRLEVIQYHGAATDLDAAVTDRALADMLDRLECIFELANKFQHSIALDMASSLKATKPMALLIPALEIFFRGSGRRIYMEQRPAIDQVYMHGVPTVSMFSELLRQEDRGGEPSLKTFDMNCENILAMDVAPPDRDPLDAWDEWIVEEIEVRQNAGFTVAVPTHSMVRRQRWDLLRQIFGDPA